MPDNRPWGEEARPGELSEFDHSRTLRRPSEGKDWRWRFLFDNFDTLALITKPEYNPGRTLATLISPVWRLASLTLFSLAGRPFSSGVRQGKEYIRWSTRNTQSDGGVDLLS